LPFHVARSAIAGIAGAPLFIPSGEALPYNGTV
jgi:hypothetical protein